MTTPWTEAARAELEEYFSRLRPALRATGADVEEVIEDLRRHLEAETTTAKLSVVTESDLQRLLKRIGAPEPEDAMPATSSAPGFRISHPPAPPKAGFFLLLVGVFMPAITFTIEFITGMCGATFFDPMPSLWHKLLVAFVPVANTLVWLAVKQQDLSRRVLLGWLNGAAIGISIFYSLLFIPLMLPGVIAVIFMGFGLLPLTPIFALVATLFLRKKLALSGSSANETAGLPGFWRGLALAALALALIEAPVFLTRLQLERATSGDAKTRLSGIMWLRSWGHEETMLRACYGWTRGAQNADLVGWITSGAQRVSTDEAREIFFRVTGTPFNNLPAPEVRTARGTWNELNDWTWDDDHGGERVGGRLKGLSIHNSRLDTTINAEAAWSYTEWTMEFKNVAGQQREARAQILLPPGGVVSRLTLWVNGEEREAAFAGRAQTRKAYQEVAVVQRRDPVLVTTSGPDRILMQCFPVPANGGTIKIRLGITAPLHLAVASEGLVRLPMLLERNFTIPQGFQHSVWAHSRSELKSANPHLAFEPGYKGDKTLRGQITDTELVSTESLLRVTRDPARISAWTQDTRDSGKRFIRQSISERPSIKPERIVFVVDGSIGMAPHWDAIRETIQDFANEPEFHVMVASDEMVEDARRPLLLKQGEPSGGQDNVPALSRAWTLAAQKTNSVIVWIHGPQPLLLDSAETLTQAAERTAYPPRLIDVQTDLGPDRVLEKLEGLRSVQPWLRTGALSNDLARLVKHLQGADTEWRLYRETIESETTAKADGAIEGELHLARLWARDEILRLKKSREVDRAVVKAGVYQLVTPVSGAVVLETQAQFAASGLTPVPAETVPSVPEPSAAALLILGCAAILFRRRR